MHVTSCGGGKVAIYFRQQPYMGRGGGSDRSLSPLSTSLGGLKSRSISIYFKRRGSNLGPFLHFLSGKATITIFLLVAASVSSGTRLQLSSYFVLSIYCKISIFILSCEIIKIKLYQLKFYFNKWLQHLCQTNCKCFNWFFPGTH